ncbi:MAG: aldehyde dehydrogenase family protein, partial [Candidatus Bipolaricaulia bacterium]
VNHPDIKKVAFTGQVETGKQIMKDAASQVKDVTLELGSSGPLIVAPDADVQAAAEAAAYRGFRNMGQICNSVNRVYVYEDNYDEFLKTMLEVVRGYEIADGREKPDADLGPMVNKDGIKKTKSHIRDALDKGAQLEYGGESPQGNQYNSGHFFLPTVLTDVNHEMMVMTEETFGPVVPIMKVSSVDEAVDYANDTIYGLVAYLFIDGQDRGMDIAEELEYGTVGINNVSGGDVPYPYSGWKQSGLGVELSEYGLEEYLEIKHIRSKSLP